MSVTCRVCCSLVDQVSPPVDYDCGPLPCDSRCVPWTMNQLISGKSQDSGDTGDSGDTSVGDSTSSDDSSVTFN